MKIYLINKVSNELIQTFDNVISWSVDFVEYTNNGYKAKFYCADTEYFTDKNPIEEVTNGE